VTGRFDTYIYTNCRADEGLQQRDGFQFQAMSPGADRAAMPLVQRRLLYEPAPQWMREGRPVSDYPPSLAHVHDRLYATAAGIYLGREAIGGREGNQLTHAIATSTPEAYGLVRPAQLLGAPFWTTVPAPAQQCPPLEPGWRPGPFGVVDAQRFVRGQDRGTSLLTALLSHLRRGPMDRRRVLFLARDPEIVLRWVTAATLLIPHQEALGIDFKIFTLNPAYADHRILAVHPDWSTGAASLDNQLGYIVFDLIRHGWTKVPEDSDSRRWVDLFVNEDPYDVADAVEVAAAAANAHPPLGLARTAFALAVVLGHPPDTLTIPPIIGWLKANPPDLVERYGAELVDQLLVTAVRWPVAELIQLDGAVRAVLPQRAAAVRLALLRTEIQATERVSERSPRPLPPVEPPAWDEEAETAAVDLLAEAMRTAPRARFERLLRLAARFDVVPPHPLLEPGLQRFIEDWAQHPERDYDLDAWVGSPEIEEKLRVLLGRRLAAEPSAAERLGDAWWGSLLTEPNELTTPLDQAIVAAAVAALDGAHRAGFVEEMLKAAKQFTDPGVGIRVTAEVLWQRSSPTPAEAQRIVALAPDGLELGAEYFPRLSAALLEEPVKDADFEAAFALTGGDRRLWLPATQIMEQIVAERNLRFVMHWVCRTKLNPTEIADVTRRIPAKTLHTYRKRLLDAMMKAPLAAAALAVLESAPQLRPAFTRRISRALIIEPWNPAYMAAAFVLDAMPPSPHNTAADEQVLAHLEKTLSDFLVRTSGGRLGEVGSQIEELEEPWPTRWVAYLRSTRPRGLSRIVHRLR